MHTWAHTFMCTEEVKDEPPWRREMASQDDRVNPGDTEHQVTERTQKGGWGKTRAPNTEGSPRPLGAAHQWWVWREAGGLSSGWERGGREGRKQRLGFSSPWKVPPPRCGGTGLLTSPSRPLSPCHSVTHCTDSRVTTVALGTGTPREISLIQ